MTLVTTMIQGKDVVVGLRDKKNWEQHTTQQQREDPAFSTSYGDNLKSKEPSETPKTSSPVETPKVEVPNIPQDIPSTNKPIEDRPSGKNYRIEAMRALLTDRIASEDKFIDFYIKQSGIDEGSEKAKGLRKAVDGLRDKLANVEKNDNPNLPHIPMGKNTHVKSTKGFIHGGSMSDTVIKIQSGMEGEPAFNLLNDQLKSAWNNLPDEHRNLVKTLHVKRSRAGYGRGGKAGSFNGDKGDLIINISTSKSADVVSTLYHEIGHAKWHKAKIDNPEGVEKFIEGMKALGTAPTKYSESYRNFERVNHRSENDYRRNMKRGGFPINEKNESTLQKNAKRAKTLYYNESHSELNSYAMGTLPKDRIIVTDSMMTKCLNVYKEMYGLE